MSDRRIRPEQEPAKREERLKAIAGLLQKLTYPEMMRLSELLQEHEQVAENGYPEALLAIAEKILAE